MLLNLIFNIDIEMFLKNNNFFNYKRKNTFLKGVNVLNKLFLVLKIK